MSGSEPRIGGTLFAIDCSAANRRWVSSRTFRTKCTTYCAAFSSAGSNISDLVGHVNEDAVRFVLPFASLTKAELVKQVRSLGLDELARRSVSCILHPYRRPDGRQCGICVACVYRRQAMFAAGVAESTDAYGIDLFSPDCDVNDKQMRAIRAFRQQAARLAELNGGRVPEFFRRYLYRTHAVQRDEELKPHVEVYRRYQIEWANLIGDARRRGLRWVTPSCSLSFSQGAA
jgi:hypothetical protein